MASVQHHTPYGHMVSFASCRCRSRDQGPPVFHSGVDHEGRRAGRNGIALVRIDAPGRGARHADVEDGKRHDRRVARCAVPSRTGGRQTGELDREREVMRVRHLTGPSTTRQRRAHWYRRHTCDVEHGSPSYPAVSVIPFPAPMDTSWARHDGPREWAECCWQPPDSVIVDPDVIVD